MGCSLSQDEADDCVDGLQPVCDLVDDPVNEPAVSCDSNDADLVAIANASGADAFVSGDRDLLVLPSPPLPSPSKC